MGTPGDRRAALSALLNERRVALDLTWAQLAGRAGVSYETLRAIRFGTGDIRDLTVARIERALNLPPGTIRHTLTGPGTPPAAGRPQPQGPPRGDTSWRDVAATLRRQIGAGERAGWLPPEKDLAAELGAAHGTIRKALDDLRRAGLVVTERGRGSRVVPPGERPRQVP